MNNKAGANCMAAENSERMRSKFAYHLSRHAATAAAAATAAVKRLAKIFNRHQCEKARIATSAI